MSSSSKKYYRDKIAARRKEEKPDEVEEPKYRDRAKESREDQNPDYDEQTELGAFHAVAPPRTVDLRSAANAQARDTLERVLLCLGRERVLLYGKLGTEHF
ncbi:hypothetical protein SAY86_009740 [Trapa natans]|uniref:RED-like N-terminal domain-containing protein n=1 Tax=Trapa natans TaxID=22666 RepID=A0AAN7L4G1_TRANT|nr:hypothetical protein SAY86_009740 [Trapa natans]